VRLEDKLACKDKNTAEIYDLRRMISCCDFLKK
jgi:hypothetical protein